jgi:hypothetical protein
MCEIYTTLWKTNQYSHDVMMTYGMINNQKTFIELTKLSSILYFVPKIQNKIE